MTTQRPVQTKALSAFFQSRGSTLQVALAQVGLLDSAILNADTVSADMVGRIARRFGFTPERLTELAAAFERA